MTYQRDKKGNAVNLRMLKYKLYIGLFKAWNTAVVMKKIGMWSMEFEYPWDYRKNN